MFDLLQPHLILLYLYPLVPKKEMEGRSGQCCWRGWVGGGSGIPCSQPTFPSLPHFMRPGVLGCHTPEAAWEVCIGVSLPIYFELVDSALPGALVNGVYRASLFFVHPSQCDCCSSRSGRNCTCFETWGRIIALFFLTSYRHRIFFFFAS